MKQILLGALGMLALAAAIVLLAVAGGLPDFAADRPHSAVTHRLIEWAREQSIARRAAAVVVPADLAAATRIRRGAGNYDAMCASCHLAPGVAESEIAKGLYPAPPNFAKPAAGRELDPDDARRFWIIKHGIKGSGMSAWSKGGMQDPEIWDLVAFLKVLPQLSPEAYRREVAASGGHSHGGMAGHGDGSPRPQRERRQGGSATADAPSAHEH